MNPLKKKFGFDEEQLERVNAALENNPNFINEMARMNLHIKGLGLVRADIVDIATALGTSSTDFANWSGITKLRGFLENDSERAMYAYMAGLSPEHVKNMNPSETTLSKLKTLAALKAL